jgi:hypothetical protein
MREVAHAKSKERTRAKAQSSPSSEKTGNFSSLRSWRLGASKFVELVLSKISKVTTKDERR